MAFPPIMSLFNSRNTAPIPATTMQAPTTQNSAPNTTTGVSDNPTAPSGNNQTTTGAPAAFPPTATGDKSPLANFADLWKVDTTQPGPDNKSLVPQFNIDPAKILESASKIDFTKSINPDVIDKALAGDRAAFLTAINQSAQLGFAHAVTASGELVKNSMNTAQEALNNRVLPTAIRQATISQAIDASNPAFTNPAVAPMLDNLKAQLALKYPTASPQEIATTAQAYLVDMASLINSNVKQTPAPTQSGSRVQVAETDWTSFFGA